MSWPVWKNRSSAKLLLGVSARRDDAKNCLGVGDATFRGDSRSEPTAHTAMKATKALLARSVWKGNIFLFCTMRKLPTDCFPRQVPTSSRKSGLQNQTAISLPKHCPDIYLHSSLPIVTPKPGERTPPIKTQARSATILPNFVGLKFQVHNGKIYNDVTITEEMVGHKLGEFSP